MKPDKIYIIAEAGVNHNGSLEVAKKLVDVAAEAGADAVKFQTFRAEQVVVGTAPKAAYQITNTGAGESQLEMLKKLELDAAAHLQLMQHCRERKIDFLSSPFDTESVDLLTGKLGLKLLKVASGELTNAPLLLHVARSGASVILSTGMSTLDEVQIALGVLTFGFLYPHQTPSGQNFRKAFVSDEGRKILREKVTLLHCTSEYPAPFEEVNLRTLATIRQAFALPVGLSDHTPGISIPIAAAALGASMIEKHFTLDRHLPGPDHLASLEPEELKRMVTSIRQVEAALGSPEKRPTPSEHKNALIARRSLIASRNIQKGERFAANNLTVKRPGTGVSPIEYWDWIGKKADRDYSKDEVITP